MVIVMTDRSRLVIWISAPLIVIGVSTVSGVAGVKLGRQIQLNKMCCQVPAKRNLVISVEELLGLARFHSETGQDKWVFEAIFPGVTNGFFLDVGSGEGTADSNSKSLEQRGWRGVCIDAFPRKMEGRTCQVFKEVVFSESGKRVTFRVPDELDLGGIVDTLGRWKESTAKARTEEFTTVTLGDILERAQAPRFIHFLSLDIEGAELEALRGFPFDRYTVGALDVEHNWEEPKRSQIFSLLKSHGYRRVHTWEQDDYYVSDVTGVRCPWESENGFAPPC
jgi:FkbM family methyltransferase